MQTDLWLTETGNYDRCPLCSKPLRRGSQTCFACGFSSSTPAVWIDPTVRSYQHAMPQSSTTRNLSPETPDPQAASPVWQYESPDFEAAGSLPMLSLFVPETPTQPQSPVRDRATTRRLPEAAEFDAAPMRAMVVRDIDQIDTLPPGRGREQRGLIIAPQHAPAEAGPRSWTAGAGSGSPFAQLIVRSGSRKRAQRVAIFHPLDEMRWWLLRPGRIEFILWLGGTLLLIGVTCLLLFVSALSFQWITPFAASSQLASGANGANAQQRNVLPGAVAPSLTVLDANPLVPGQSFPLRGAGFKPATTITFYFDGKLPLFNQSQRQAWVHTDAHGTFQSTLWLGTGPAWSSGEHIIAARDASGAPLTAVVIHVASSANNNSTIASSSPVPVVTPGGTHTGSPTPTGPQGTPVSRPPVTVTPTLTVTPAPTRTTPTATPTVKTSPTVTPTVKTSPTPTKTPARGTPTPRPTAANTALGNALNDSGVPPAARLTSVSPLIWIMVACYLLSMLSLGAAGVMYRRNRKIGI